MLYSFSNRKSLEYENPYLILDLHARESVQEGPKLLASQKIAIF